MDTPENYYAILGIPLDANGDTLKRAYRQLARRYHPDVAGPAGANEMKRLNRAYAVLSDPEKRQNYDTVIGGIIDLRRVHIRPRPHVFDPTEDVAFSGFNIFSTKGPFRAGPVLHTALGVISALSSVQTVQGMLIVAGSLDGKGTLWQLTDGSTRQTESTRTAINFAADPVYAIESLRELRFSSTGTLLAGWGRLGLHVWDAYSGTRLWSYSLLERAVSAHYSLDTTFYTLPDGRREVRMALPLLVEDTHARSPRAWGVRGTDVVSNVLNSPLSPEHIEGNRENGETKGASSIFANPQVCTEEDIESRRFWAIRLRALDRDSRTLVTLSCAHAPNETHEMAIVRSWDLNARSRLGKARPQIATSILVGPCADCTPPYAITPDARTLAFVYRGHKMRICDTDTGTYSELLSGTMGSSSKIALSPDAHWLAVAREDSEINEGVIDLWSIRTGQVIQKFYHPWQISALHFAEKQLVVALTDGTVQIWE